MRSEKFRLGPEVVGDGEGVRRLGLSLGTTVNSLPSEALLRISVESRRLFANETAIAIPRDNSITPTIGKMGTIKPEVFSLDSRIPFSIRA